MINGPALEGLDRRDLNVRTNAHLLVRPSISDLAIERHGPDPKGDRVKITMSGKFLPYKYYGSTGNHPAYGYKE